MKQEALIKLLGTIMPADRVLAKLIDRVAYAGDAGFYQLIPKAVVQPVSDEEIVELFKLANQQGIPLVFRAAGTSLSGQSITDGILVDISKYWRNCSVLDNGKKVKVQPGIIGAMVNHYLKPYGTKIGPDPASINAAMMGGILSNNASGMCCGVAHNSYHTLHSMRFVLPDGSGYDTGAQGAYEQFETQHAPLAQTLATLRSEIESNDWLKEKIRNKYKIKNTVGYALNAFIDYDHPLDIFAHLLIGAEGTLGFISEATLHTLPDLPFKTAAMLYFGSITQACSAVPMLVATGAEALELMDRKALQSVEHLPGLPPYFTQLPAGAAALLCEYQAESETELQMLMAKSLPAVKALPLLQEATFTTNEKERMFYWKIRKGMFPSVGAVRQSGTTVILEDVAFPVASLGHAIVRLQQCFAKHGYSNAIIFGHAKDGNIHFVVTQHLDSVAEIERYDAFMQDVVKIVVHEFNGSLKGEHGTGRNMAPFVETEWGSDAYRIMKTLKQAVDPNNILNPGVIINNDPTAHIRHLKQMPTVEEEVDKCIECGFCEHHCPSRDVTLTPRQRIQVRRHLRQLASVGNQSEYGQLLKEYQYAGLDTCAADGLCQTDCPVQINTGDLVKRLRSENHSKGQNKAANYISSNFSLAESIVRTAITAGVATNNILGKKFMPSLLRTGKFLLGDVPDWWPEMTKPPEKLSHEPAHPAIVYFSSCLHRIMGRPANHKPGIQQVVLDLCDRAGIDILLPHNLPGHCCGQAFASKGFYEASKMAEEKTIDALLQWSQQGTIPIMVDFTSCTYQFSTIRHKLSAQYQKKFDRLHFVDCISFLQDFIAPNIAVTNKLNSVVLHPTCASTKLGLQQNMQMVAQHFADEVIVPPHAGCCGMAGDRGFLFPELTHAATQQELADLSLTNANGYYSTGRTCEMAMTHHGNHLYEHLLYLAWDTTC